VKGRLERLLWIGSGIVLAVSVVSVLVFVFGTIASRAPYWGEAEVLFEASRIRSGYPLFIDPIVGGATEYGEPPSRFFVTYPPILSLVFAAIPSAAAMIVGRILASLAWFGSLAWIVRSSSKEERPNAIAAAAFIAGIWVIANFAATARPDSFACACAAIGLNRAVMKKQIDLPSLCLLILAAWLKPTLLGLPAGAIIANKNLRTALFAVTIAAVSFLLFHFLTGGKLVSHVIASNAQPFSFAIWLDRITHHLPFFGPLFVVALVHHKSANRIARGAMIGSLAWVLLAIAKTGSSANYWMEPCVAALVLLAHTKGPFSFGKSGLVHAAITLAVVLYADVAAITSSFRQMNHYQRESAFLTKVRSQCDSGAIASDEQGLELALNNRIIIPAYQMSWLVHEGKFPREIYVDTITAPPVKCFLIHKSASPIAAPEIQTAIATHFPIVVSEDEGLRLLSIR
jgi:hypothetical protein